MQSFVDLAESLKESDPEAAAQEPLLPWTDEEELKVGLPDAHPAGRARTPLRLAALFVAIFSAVIALIRMLGPAPGTKVSSKEAAKAEKVNSWRLLGGRPE